MHLVNLRRPGQIARCVVVVSLLCSWLAISNHCAIAAVSAQTAATASECPFHSKPAKKETPAAVQECCKTLRAIVAKAAKGWARDDAHFAVVDSSVSLPIILTDTHATAPLLLDTGPPGASTFAELVLQRSLLAHAPPLIA
jgi:hypothetical protein